MTDLTDPISVELDDWRDLVSSSGWHRLLQAFETQWGDAQIVTTIERLMTKVEPAGASIADESWRLLKVRVAMREFLAYPAHRISDLERQRTKDAAPGAKPWTRPA